MTGPERVLSGDRYDERDHERFSLVPAAYVMLLREDPGFRSGPGVTDRLGRSGAGQGTQVLLQLRQNTGYRDGYWALGAAGHVEEGESVVDAAVREAREELGVRVDPARLVPVTVLHRGEPGGPAIEQRVDFFFLARRWEGRPSIQEPTKAAGLTWAPLAALPTPLVPHEEAVLAAVRTQESGGAVVPPLMTRGFGGIA